MQIKVLSQHYLGPKKSLVIVRVAGESILVGVTDSNISMIKSLALIDDEVPVETPKNFADALNSEKAPMMKLSKAASSTVGMSQDELEEEFSFSGLKTAVLYLVQKIGQPSDETKSQIAREFEDAATEVVVEKVHPLVGLNTVKEYIPAAPDAVVDCAFAFATFPPAGSVQV